MESTSTLRYDVFVAVIGVNYCNMLLGRDTFPFGPRDLVSSVILEVPSSLYLGYYTSQSQTFSTLGLNFQIQ
jgi:hypothetical protein